MPPLLHCQPNDIEFAESRTISALPVVFSPFIKSHLFFSEKLHFTNIIHINIDNLKCFSQFYVLRLMFYTKHVLNRHIVGLFASHVQKDLQKKLKKKS
jgi:hypothetical protein